MQPPERNERTLKKKTKLLVCTVSLLVRSTKYISFARRGTQSCDGDQWKSPTPGAGLLGPLAEAGGTDGSWSGGTNTETCSNP